MTHQEKEAFLTAFQEEDYHTFREIERYVQLLQDKIENDRCRAF
ncbi:hypothetical protein ABQH43_04625 [Streptococcus sp. ZJ100]